MGVISFDLFLSILVNYLNFHGNVEFTSCFLLCLCFIALLLSLFAGNARFQLGRNACAFDWVPNAREMTLALLSNFDEHQQMPDNQKLDECRTKGYRNGSDWKRSTSINRKRAARGGSSVLLPCVNVVSLSRFLFAILLANTFRRKTQRHWLQSRIDIGRLSSSDREERKSNWLVWAFLSLTVDNCLLLTWLGLSPRLFMNKNTPFDISLADGSSYQSSPGETTTATVRRKSRERGEKGRKYRDTFLSKRARLGETFLFSIFSH